MTAPISYSTTTHATSLTGIGPTGDPMNGLSADALLAYIQAKLGDSDSQIKTLLNHQKVVEQEQQQVQGLLDEVNSLDSRISKDDQGNGKLTDPAACQKLAQDIENLVSQIQAADPSCPSLDDLKALHDRVMATGSGPYDGHGYYNGSSAQAGQPPNGSAPPSQDLKDQDNTFGADELKQFADSLNSINSDLSSGAQIQMIELQSKVSDRSTSIQLATNIMQSVSDAEQKTVANIHA
jgi:hypothetical protein